MKYLFLALLLVGCAKEETSLETHACKLGAAINNVEDTCKFTIILTTEE